jgi:hypothetical protein
MVFEATYLVAVLTPGPMSFGKSRKRTRSFFFACL